MIEAVHPWRREWILIDFNCLEYDMTMCIPCCVVNNATTGLGLVPLCLMRCTISDLALAQGFPFENKNVSGILRIDDRLVCIYT